jgi:molybdopterin-guanine dinucleotide biosynthesis protein A
MGSDKALLAWGCETMLQRAIATARAACGEIYICGPQSLYRSFGEVVEDAEPGRGPLSGIQAALRASRTDLNLILSVDLPLMTTEFLIWLVQQARAGEQMITMPEALGRLQPLCAAYNRQVLEHVDNALAQGEFKVTRLTTRVATRIVSEEEMQSAGFGSRIFANLNTPEEYESLLQVSHGMTEPRHG